MEIPALFDRIPLTLFGLLGSPYAYHSLSLEGYGITLELIDGVLARRWDPDDHDDDRQNRDALAARGYCRPFRS
jgi:hypothetical protein